MKKFSEQIFSNNKIFEKSDLVISFACGLIK